MNEDLPRLVAGLHEQARKGEDLSSGISRVRAAIKKVIEGGDTIFGRFHALVESFRGVISEENLRYEAAIKALSATAKLSRREIVASVDKQLQELAILEKVLILTLPRAGELKATEARSQELRNEISRLRGKIAQLEREEQEIEDRMAGREKETAVLAKAMRAVFADIGAEITSIREKLGELHGGPSAQQPADTEVHAGHKQSSGQNSIAGGLSSYNSAKPQRTCPLCAAQMSLSATAELWQCSTCKHVEREEEEVRGKAEPGADTVFPGSPPASEPKQPCPLCGGRMDYYLAEKKWQCFSCAYEEPENAGVHTEQGELSADAIFPEPAPELKQNEKGEQTTTPGPSAASEQKQQCPLCGGRMDYYLADRKWQCYSCGYEYDNDEGQAKDEEKGKGSNALLAIPLTEPLFDHSPTNRPSPGYWGGPQKASSSKKLPMTSTCPGCGKKMHSIGPGKGWQCRSCGYERRL